MELKYIVYITINQCNGKFYIGVHKTNPDVFDGYIGCGIYRTSNASKEHAFHKAVRKYGYENFKRTTLRIFDTEEEAYEFEKQLVTPTLLKSKTCYNMSVGGKGGVPEDLCKRVYKFSLKGEYLTSYKSVLEAALSIGIENTESVKHAIKNNCSKRVNSAYGYFWSYTKKFESIKKNLQPVAQYTLTGKFLRYYDSISEACFNLGVSTISQAIKEQCSCGGYYWRYYNGNTEDIQTNPSIFFKNKVLPIVMVNCRTKQCTEYSSVNECVKSNPNLSASQINRVLKGIIRTHKGYIFKYKDEDIV